MAEETCAMCERKIVAEKADDIIRGAYGSLCSIKCFDELCDLILWVNRKEFKGV